MLCRAWTVCPYESSTSNMATRVRTSLLTLIVLLWDPVHALHGPNVCSRTVRTQATRTILRYYTCPVQKIRRSYVDTEEYTATTPQLYCCDGYRELQNKCEPVCTRACTNGFCSGPATCSCLPGYKRKSATECEPSCPTGCGHGTCTAPNTCTCARGYQKQAGVCAPVCAGGCNHGTCTAPGVCTCESGYLKTAAKGNTRCVPVCSTPCQHGRCSAPDTCTCDPGYENVTQNTCKPRCSDGCVNGACAAPEKCVCDEFYVKDIVSGKCVAEVLDVQPE